MNKCILFLILVLLFLCNSERAYSASCKPDSKIIGFSTVKSSNKGKAYFYKEPRLCEKEKSCSSIRKAYLLTNDFVQTAQVSGQFVCAIFRNFNGWGGKETFGWLRLDDLNPIRTKLEIKDLIGSWVQIPCGVGDDCVINISADKNMKLEVFFNSHLHERPAYSFRVDSIKEIPGKLLLTRIESGEEKVTVLELEYGGSKLEPGTISITGDDFFEGIYLK